MIRIQNKRRRKISSRLWLERQLNDPFVLQAQKHGYRARSAFKLREIDDTFHILKPGQKILDLGANPGSWSQVIVERTAPVRNRGCVIAVDKTVMQPLAETQILTADLLDPCTQQIILQALDGYADVVLSDMSLPTVGHRQTDHLRTMSLAEAAFELCCQVLCYQGVFVCKVFQGTTHQHLLKRLQKSFLKVRHKKPQASRPQSGEMYLVATGFRGLPTETVYVKGR